MMDVAFVNIETMNEKYQGYNPEFVRRVLARRREQQREERAGRERARRTQMKAEQKERLKQKRKKLQEDQARRDEIMVKAEDYALPETKKRRMAREIIAEVANNLGATYGDVVGPSRSKWIVKVRDVAMRAVAEERPDMSLPMLGRAFNRDHTSCIAALRRTWREGMPVKGITNRGKY